MVLQPNDKAEEKATALRGDALQEAITAQLRAHDLQQLRKLLAAVNIVDVAEALGGLSAEDVVVAFRVLPKDSMADVFSYLDPDSQNDIVAKMTDREIGSVVGDLYLDDTVDFLEEMPANVVKRVLRLTDDKTRGIIQQLLRYPKNTAASIMTIEFMEIHDRFTVKQAIEHIRETGFDKETLYTCYVIDDVHHLIGTVALRRLIMAPESALIRDIMQESVIAVRTDADQEAVAMEFSKYDLISMPVTDREGRLVGLITVDDIVDVIHEEHTEDIEKMAAIIPSDKEYLRTGVFELMKNRLPWLLLLMLSATFTGTIIAHYEGLLASTMVLSSFIPMLMNTGGNSGSQSSAMMIRGLALGEIRPRDAVRVVLKELRVSAMLGFALSVVNFIRIMLFNREAGPFVALAVSMSICVTVVMATLIGGLMPLLAKKLRLDPAVMAAPLITTIVDALSLIVFFTIATRLLRLA